jgi:hypothetical protein
MIRHPLFAEPRGRGWYIADAEMRDVRGVVYISKRAAVVSIRAMPEATETGHLARAPFLYGKRIRPWFSLPRFTTSESMM